MNIGKSSVESAPPKLPRFSLATLTTRAILRPSSTPPSFRWCARGVQFVAFRRLIPTGCALKCTASDTVARFALVRLTALRTSSGHPCLWMLRADRKNAFVFPELVTNVVHERSVVTSVNHLVPIASEQELSVSPPTRTILIRSPLLLGEGLVLLSRLNPAYLLSHCHPTVLIQQWTH